MAEINKVKFSRGTKTEAAKKLGISRTLLNHKLRNNDVEAVKMVVKVEKERIVKEKANEIRANQILESLSQMID